MPADLIDEDESDPEILRSIYPDLDPSDPLLAHVDQVATAPEQHDGLESRLEDQDDAGTPYDPKVQDWRTLSPDDPKGQLVQARVPDSLVKHVDHLISRTRAEVWATRSDFVREAIWSYTQHVINALQISEPTLISMFTEAELAGRAQFHAARRTRLEQSIDHVRSYLTDLINLDDYAEAHRFVLEVALRVRGIRVVSWRRQWLLNLNALPILRIVVRLLDMQGLDIPVEFYPAAGRGSVVPTVSSRITAPPRITLPGVTDGPAGPECVDPDSALGGVRPPAQRSSDGDLLGGTGRQDPDQEAQGDPSVAE